MDSFVFPAPMLGSRGQALVFTYDDGRVTIAYRARPSDRWCPPIDATEVSIHSDVTPIG